MLLRQLNPSKSLLKTSINILKIILSYQQQCFYKTLCTRWVRLFKQGWVCFCWHQGIKGEKMGEIGFYFDHFIRESGILLYIVILLGAIIIVWLVWQQFKIKKVQSEFLQNRAFED